MGECCPRWYCSCWSAQGGPFDFYCPKQEWEMSPALLLATVQSGSASQQAPVLEQQRAALGGCQRSAPALPSLLEPVVGTWAGTAPKGCPLLWLMISRPHNLLQGHTTSSWTLPFSQAPLQIQMAPTWGSAMLLQLYIPSTSLPSPPHWCWWTPNLANGSPLSPKPSLWVTTVPQT